MLVGWPSLCSCIFGDKVLLLWLQKCGRTNEAYSEGVDPFEELTSKTLCVERSREIAVGTKNFMKSHSNFITLSYNLAEYFQSFLRTEIIKFVYSEKAKKFGAILWNYLCSQIFEAFLENLKFTNIMRNPIDPKFMFSKQATKIWWNVQVLLWH